MSRLLIALVGLVGRIVTGPKVRPDSYVDMASYAAIAGEMALRAAKPE